MAQLTLKTVSYHDCSIGRLFAKNGKDIFRCFTLELPWVNNLGDISCIPSGEYEYYFRDSPKNGRVLELRDVPERAFIQIHSGNFRRQTLGCILVGESITHIDGDTVPDVTNSRNTLALLLQYAGREGTIEIIGQDRELR